MVEIIRCVQDLLVPARQQAAGHVSPVKTDGETAYVSSTGSLIENTRNVSYI